LIRVKERLRMEMGIKLVDKDQGNGKLVKRNESGD
jgi:hypothetical protein